MNSMQSYSTLKIRKMSRKNSSGLRNFVCGACPKAYKSYSSLWLHIRIKHDGVRPSGTTVRKHTQIPLDSLDSTDRPQKCDKNIDDIGETKVFLEAAQNDLMRLLGEKLSVMKDMILKPTMESVVQKIVNTMANEHSTNEWLKDLQEGSKDFLLEYNRKDLLMKNPDFEEDFLRLDTSNGRKVIVWFLIWLGKLYVKDEFIPDLSLTFAMVWKVMSETRLEVQDLDNKLVWRKIMKECEGLLKDLYIFKNDLTLLAEFIRIVCQIIGTAFDEF